VSQGLNAGRHGEAFPVGSGGVAAPLPRAHQWVDGSAYVNHVELVAQGGGADHAASFWTDPLVYQGGSDAFLGPTDEAPFLSEEWGIRSGGRGGGESWVTCRWHPAAQVRSRHDIRLFMLVNDWTLRQPDGPELAKGFGFYQSKPATAFSPSAVTSDELGTAWDGGKLQLPAPQPHQRAVAGRPRSGHRHDL